MSKVTLKDLWKIAKRENQPLLGLTTDLTTLDFMDDYLEKNEAFDRDIARNQGFFAPVWNLDEEDDADDVFEQWQKDVYYFLLKNKENYQRLYDLLSITYDPLCNYDKTSVITDQESGTDKDTNVIGARHREDTYAQRQDTDAYGAVSHTDSLGAQMNSTVHGAQETTDAFGAVSHTDTIGARSDSTVHGEQETTDAFGAVSKSDIYGAVSESDTIGARSDSVTHGAQTNTDSFGAVSETTTHGAKETGTVDKIAGFNSVGFDNANSSTTNEGQQADTHTENAKTDSHTTAQYIDSTSVGAQTNSHTENSKTDTHSELAKTDTHTLATFTDTQNIGEQSNGHTETAKTDTHTLATYTDTDNIGAQQNTHTELAKTDTHTQGSHKDEFDENQATDELTKLYGHLNTHNERTTGNIGVTTSQQMAQSEIDLWHSFRFYDILFGDIIKELCHFYDEGYDCF